MPWEHFPSPTRLHASTNTVLSGPSHPIRSRRLVREGNSLLGVDPIRRYAPWEASLEGEARLNHGDAGIDDRLQAELAAWSNLPAGGGPLGQRIRRLLETAGDGPLRTAGALAEARVARRLLIAGCDLEPELPTPNGRTCDFEVTVNGERFFLHVKCLQMPHAPRPSLPGFLRSIEQVERPFLVEVNWRENLEPAELASFAKVAREFVAEGRIGEELLHRDALGHPAGTARITGVLARNRAVVAVAQCTPSMVSRVGRLMERAYVQFMPGGENVILILTEDAAHDRLVDLALLGTHVERWDKIPRSGRMIAHGRAEDGFWSGEGFDLSRVVGWMQLESGDARPRLWFRHPDSPSEQLRATVAGALGAD